jgi:hypothetical protein
MVTVPHPALTMHLVKIRVAATVMVTAYLRHVQTVHNRIAAANVPLRVRKINLKPKRVQTGL